MGDSELAYQLALLLLEIIAGQDQRTLTHFRPPLLTHSHCNSKKIFILKFPTQKSIKKSPCHVRVWEMNNEWGWKCFFDLLCCHKSQGGQLLCHVLLGLDHSLTRKERLGPFNWGPWPFGVVGFIPWKKPSPIAHSPTPPSLCLVVITSSQSSVGSPLT